MLGVGFGISPSVQEHKAFRSTTEHQAFGPHGFTSFAHGFWQKLFLQNSLGPQSSSCRQPYEQVLARQMCPRKQSLSTLHVTER